MRADPDLAGPIGPATTEANEGEDMRVFAYATLVVAALGVATVTAPAQAQAAEKPQHCVVDVSTAGQKMSCYDSFTTAIAKATKGRVTDAPADVRTAMRDPKLTAELNDTSFAPAGGFVLSTEYDGSNFASDSISYTGSTGCDEFDDVDFELAYVGDRWNDDISSYRAFSNCLVIHWEHRDFMGRPIGPDGGRADMGFMDDEASSIQWI
ncbi:hypothetical protein [Flindersiella endophytica]